MKTTFSNSSYLLVALKLWQNIKDPNAIRKPYIGDESDKCEYCGASLWRVWRERLRHSKAFLKSKVARLLLSFPSIH